MALTPLDTIADPLPSPDRPDSFEGDMDRLINTKLPRLANEVDAVATAFDLNSTLSSSSSSVDIGVGTRNYIVETGKSYLPGMFVIAADIAAPSTNYNYGQVLSHDNVTGALSIDVIDAQGSGTISSWFISHTAPGGVTNAGATFVGPIIVPSEAYSEVDWLNNFSVPTKHDLRNFLAAFSVIPAGVVMDFTGTSAPAGWLSLPLVATDVSRTVYADLFAAIGTTWGVGDGSTTFGLPYCPENYTTLQSNGNVGTDTIGEVIAHTHPVGGIADYVGAGNGRVVGNNTARISGSTGGPINMAAGVRTLKCIKF